MKKLQIILTVLLFLLLGLSFIGCSEDSMDIPPRKSYTYYVKVTEITDVTELTYSDASKTTIVQKRSLSNPSGSRIIYEKTGATESEMNAKKSKYQGLTDKYLTDQGTRINYEWNIRYRVEIQRLN